MAEAWSATTGFTNDTASNTFNGSYTGPSTDAQIIASHYSGSGYAPSTRYIWVDLDGSGAAGADLSAALDGNSATLRLMAGHFTFY